MSRSKDETDMNDRARLEYVTDSTPPQAQTFLLLGCPYMAETDPENPDIHQRFLQSILRRQGEPDRWLAMFMLGDQVFGFAHFKIDKDERPGSGYILEFYVVPERRRRGLGQECLSLITNILTVAGCKTVWLASHSTAEAFWRACGFRETEELERSQKVMIKALPTGRDSPDGVKER